MSYIFFNHYAANLVRRTIKQINAERRSKIKITLKQRGLLQALALRYLLFASQGKPGPLLDAVVKDHISKGAPQEIVPRLREKLDEFIKSERFKHIVEFGSKFEEILDKHGITGYTRHHYYIFANKVFRACREFPKSDRWEGIITQVAYYTAYHNLDEEILKRIAQLVNKYYDLVMEGA